MGLFACVAGGASTLRNAGSIAAIVGASIAAVGFAASLGRGWLRRRKRNHLGNLLYQGNELQVRFNRTAHTDPGWDGLIADMDEWFAKVERSLRRNPALLAVLRSDVGIGHPTFGHPERAYRQVWLPQRIKQLEKVIGQL